MSTDESLGPNQLRGALVEPLHQHRVLYFVEGILLLALGTVAIIVPPMATLSAMICNWVGASRVLRREADVLEHANGARCDVQHQPLDLTAGVSP